MKKVADRIIALRKALGLTQEQFASRIESTRGYISQIEAELKIPGPDFLRKLDILERSANAIRIAEKPDSSAPSQFTIVPSRAIPVLSSMRAGQAIDFELIPEDWQETIQYTGSDAKAFALKVEGDSMEPNYRQGSIITLSPSIPAINGDLVAACLKNEGVVFKRFHHSGDGKEIVLTSYNSAYPPMHRKREQFHWIYRAVWVTSKL